MGRSHRVAVGGSWIGGVLAAVLTGMLAAAPSAMAAFPGYAYFVRPADFVQPTGTRGDATMQVQADGVHIHVGDPSALAAGSFVVPGGLPLSDFNMYGYHVTYDWTGSTAQPGIHYDIDLDGDGQADLELVGEHKYGDDLWLNDDYVLASPTVPLSIIQSAAPCVDAMAQRSLRDGCSTAYGDHHHGTIEDWKSGFVAVGHPDGSVVKGGFVATGAPVDGVLADLHIGIDTFNFTTTARKPADLTIVVDQTRVAPGATVAISGTAGNTYNYPHVVLQAKTPGSSWAEVDDAVLTTGAHYSFSQRVPSSGVVKYRTLIARSSYNVRTVTEPVVVRVVPDRSAASGHRYQHRHHAR